jgi:hypothetical protein
MSFMSKCNWWMGTMSTSEHRGWRSCHFRIIQVYLKDTINQSLVIWIGRDSLHNESIWTCVRTHIIMSEVPFSETDS